MEADQQLFRIGNELANELIFQLTSTKFSGQFPYRRASLFFFCRAFKAYQAVAMLWREGFSEDAYSLARTVYELRLQAIYLSRDPAPRAKLFIRHWFKAGFGTLELLKKRGRPEWLQSLEIAEREIRAAAAELGIVDVFDDPEDAKRAIGRKWWDAGIRGTGIKGLVEELGIGEEYDWVYAQMSDYSHSGLRTFHMFVEQPSESEIRMLYEPHPNSS